MEDPSLKSWDEVNAALKLIRDNEIELELIEADMGKKDRGHQGAGGGAGCAVPG